MWKLIGLLLIVWELLADWLEPIIRSRFGKLGLSIYGAVLLYGRIRERAQGRILEARVAALEEGKRWDGVMTPSCGKVRTSLSKWSNLSRQGIAREKQRRRRGMKLDKVWLVGLIGYILSFVKMAFPQLELPDDMADQIATFVLMGLALFAVIRDMVKKYQDTRKHPFDGGVASVDPQSEVGHGPAV
ncbi:hypothetical protein [Gorillibacterium sp. sgz5001074]|uniref:hypothetical protein n=1 Tax=Gorillibacterium sp. sgz5001074 TaxID=3446695 RepID=UPI003F66DF83